jgi:hypothetical protein
MHECNAHICFLSISSLTSRDVTIWVPRAVAMASCGSSWRGMATWWRGPYRRCQKACPHYSIFLRVSGSRSSCFGSAVRLPGLGDHLGPSLVSCGSPAMVADMLLLVDKLPVVAVCWLLGNARLHFAGGGGLLPG